jgi:hypothetical protein
MNWHRLILTVGTKLPTATVGPPITLMIDDIFAPTTLGRDPPRLVRRKQLGPPATWFHIQAVDMRLNLFLRVWPICTIQVPGDFAASIYPRRGN